MRVLVDTSVWSQALRRKGQGDPLVKAELARLVQAGLVEIIGPIRQEILSGVKEHAQFESLKTKLSSFIDIELTTADHVEAASYYNICRSKGIQGSGTDLLICEVAIRHDLAIFALDDDFGQYVKALPIRLHQITAG